MRGRILLLLLAGSLGASCSYDPARATRVSAAAVGGGAAHAERGSEPVQRLAELTQGGRVANEKF